jgi:transportin-2
MCLSAIVDPLHEIRQAGFSLLGDLAKASPSYVQECLPQLMQAVIQNCQSVDEVTAGCISNAAWCIQQVLEFQQDVTPGRPLLQGDSITSMFHHFAKVLVETQLTSEMKNMSENIVLLLGNCMYESPDVAARVGLPLENLIRKWLEYARNIRKVSSRENAARGMLMAIQKQPPVVVPHLPLFFDYCISLGDAQADTKKAVIQILQAVRSGAAVQWSQAVASYSPQLMEKLYVLYAVR